jgi:hypothetical protein
MKRFLIASAAIALVVSAVSCKQCVTCYYEYEHLGDTVRTSYPEECGKSSEIKDFKVDKIAEAQRQGVELICDDTK